MAFPSSLDSLKTTWAGSEAPVGHSIHHNDMAVLVLAMMNKIGVNASAVTSSLDYLLKSTSSQNPGHKHTWADIASKPTTLGTFGITDGVVNTSPTFKDSTDNTKIATFSMANIATATTRNYLLPNKGGEFLATMTTERTGSAQDVLRGDGTWGGTGDNFTVSPNYAYAKGDPIAWNGTNWVKALGTAIANLDVYGIASAAGSSGTSVTLVQRGILSGFTGLTAGSQYYVSNTGTLSTTAGTYYCKVGYAISTTQIMVEIEKVVNEQATTNGGANNTSYYSSGFTTTRDFVAYLTSWTLDSNSQGGGAAQFDSVDVLANGSSKIKLLGKAGTVVRGRVSNGNGGTPATVGVIRICYTI